MIKKAAIYISNPALKVIRKITYLGFLIFFAAMINAAYVQKKSLAASTELETFKDILENLTCETKGIGNLLKPEMAHTCIPDSFLTVAMANMMSPGLYANMMIKLNMNDETLFPDACLRKNRANFNRPTLSFGLCSNTKLQVARVGAVGKAAIEIGTAVLSGDDAPWGSIREAWDIPPEDYYEIYRDEPLLSDGILFDFVAPLPVGAPTPAMPWMVVQDKDRICLATLAFNGYVPIGCKFIKEPFPISKYADFMDFSGNSTAKDEVALTSCSSMGSCYKRSSRYSKTVKAISGPLVECIREMSLKLLVSKNICSIDDFGVVNELASRNNSALFKFQQNMHRFVSALLTIYVIFFGFKVTLSGGSLPKSEAFNFALKIIFVTYFAVGINISSSTGGVQKFTGIVDWLLPFMLGGITELSSWIINASPSELCVFNSSEYPDGSKHLAVWDALDCRVSHYLGVDMVQTFVVDNANRNHDFSTFDVLSYPIPPYIYLLVPAVISGNINLITLALMYPLMVISVAAFVVSATVVCIIAITILSVLAPLFVPLMLFSYTKGYFESWARLLISFMLQPMIAMAFMTTMLSIYDFGFYGTCKYASSDVSMDGRNIRYYYIDNNWENYSSDEDVEGCKNSLGFMLNNPIAAILSTSVDVAGTIQDLKFPWNEAGGEQEYKNQYGMLDGIQPTPGLMFEGVDLLFEKIKRLAFSLLTAVFTLYLMYHFSATLMDFTADLSDGVTIGEMSAVTPQTIYKGAMAALGAAGSASGGGGSSNGSASAGDTAGSSSRTAGDGAMGGGGNTARDKILSSPSSVAEDSAGQMHRSSTNNSSDNENSNRVVDSQNNSEVSAEENQQERRK